MNLLFKQLDAGSPLIKWELWKELKLSIFLRSCQEWKIDSNLHCSADVNVENRKLRTLRVFMQVTTSAIRFLLSLRSSDTTDESRMMLNFILKATRHFALSRFLKISLAYFIRRKIKANRRKGRQNLKLHKVAFCFSNPIFHKSPYFQRKKSCEFGNLLKVFSQKGLLFA